MRRQVAAVGVREPAPALVESGGKPPHSKGPAGRHDRWRDGGADCSGWRRGMACRALGGASPAATIAVGGQARHGVCAAGLWFAGKDADSSPQRTRLRMTGGGEDTAATDDGAAARSARNCGFERVARTAGFAVRGCYPPHTSPRARLRHPALWLAIWQFVEKPWNSSS